MSETTAIIKIVGKDQASAELRKVRNSLGDLDKSAAKTKSATNGLLEGIAGRFGLSAATLGTTAVGAGLAFVASQSVKAASALQELESKARFVYGDAFPAVNAEAIKIAESVGRARSSILSMSADFASIILPMGVTSEAAQTMSNKFAQLSVDMASFHNRTDEEAFIALRSAITGETEPMKRFGVVMTETNLAAYALSKGIQTQVKDMNQAQKTTLRYNFILDSTKQAQGDAARTIDSYANRTRQAKEAWKEFNEELGKGITPLLANALAQITFSLETARNAINDMAKAWAAFKSMFGGMEGIDPATGKKLGPKTTGFDWSTGKSYGNDWSGTSGSLNPEFAKVQNDVKALADLQNEINSLGGGGGGGGGEGETILDKVKKIVEDIKDVEKEIFDVQKDKFDLHVKMNKTRRDDLKLLQDMGKATESELRLLDRINNRLEYKTDKVEEATDAWEEQVEKIEKVQDAIDSLNESIEEEKKKLADLNAGIGSTVDKITASSSEDAVQKAAGLIKERNKIQEDATGAFGMTGDMSRRMGEIDEDLGSFDDSTIAEAEKVAGMGSGEVIERDKQMKIDAAKAESQARIDALQVELDKEQETLEQLRITEEEKKQIVIQALSDRQTQTELVYKNLEKSTKAHVDAQVEQFNRLKSTLEALTGANASIAGFESGISTTIGGPALVPNALGGIYDKPTAASIGEAGYPEAVIPMPFGKVPVQLQGATGGNTISITVSSLVVREEADVSRIAAQLARMIQLDNLASPA